MAHDVAKANASLDLAGKTAAVSGGTQGIGAGVALRFAQLGCSRVLIVGRNEERANQVLEQLKAAAQKNRPNASFDAAFVQGDLSSTAGIRQTASKLADRSKGGIDYLVMTSGGPPNGYYKENAEGLDVSFTVQCLGRFGLAYLLSSNRTIRDGGSVISIGSPGVALSDIDLEDLSLKKRYEGGRFWPSLLVDQGKRDSMTLDAVTEELNQRYPNISYYHIFPGLVATNGLANRGFPFPLPQLGAIAGPLMRYTPFIGNSIEGISDTTAYIAANPVAKDLLKGATRLTQRLKPVPLPAWTQSGDNRSKMFAAMEGLLGAK